MNRLKINIIRIVILLLFLAVWQIVGNISDGIFFFIGSPFAVSKELFKLILYERFFYHFFITGSEALVGLLIGTILGSFVGLLLWFSEGLNKIAKPFIIGFGTLPVFAFAPLMIVWFGVGFGMKVAMAAFSTIFVAFNQANKGAKMVDSKYIDMLKGMNASRFQIFKLVIVPGSIDWVLSSMRLNVGFGLLGAFIGEFISSDVGLGYLILRAGSLYDIPRAFAASIGIIILALLLDYAAGLVEKKRHYIIQFTSVSKSIRSKDNE